MSAIASRKPMVKLESVEFLRGIAALSVVFFHLTRREEFLAGSWVKEAASYGYLGVYAFFVISGLVIPIALSSDSSRRNGILLFLRKRLMRLYPPFLFSLLIAWALLCGEAALRPDLRLGIVGALNLKTFLSNTFLCSDFSGTGWINPVYWSLAIEFQFYLLMAVGFSRFQNAGPRLQVAMVLVATMAAIPFDGHGLILTYLPLFAAGIAIWLFLSGRMGAVGTGLVIAGQSLVVYFHFGLPVALTLVGSVVFCLALKGRRFGRLLFLGNISYSLYLLHVPVGSRLVNAGLRLFHGGLLSYGLLAASVIACLLMSWIFYVLVERPCLHFSRALGKTKPDTTGISWHGLTRESFKRHSFILSRVLTKTQIYK